MVIGMSDRPPSHPGWLTGVAIILLAAGAAFAVNLLFLDGGDAARAGNLGAGQATERTGSTTAPRAPERRPWPARTAPPVRPPPVPVPRPRAPEPRPREVARPPHAPAPPRRAAAPRPPAPAPRPRVRRPPAARAERPPAPAPRRGRPRPMTIDPPTRARDPPTRAPARRTRAPGPPIPARARMTIHVGGAVAGVATTTKSTTTTDKPGPRAGSSSVGGAPIRR